MTVLKKPCRRVTVGALDGSYGKDRGKTLVATLEIGDLISLRPSGTRRTETVSLFDVYIWAIRCRINAGKMAKLRERKAKKAEQRQKREWKRELRKPV